MANVVVVGAQWGDEGKGKIVDFLCNESDAVVRFQGGHNAGHTLVLGKNEFKLSLLPSGVIRENKISIIGNGVVLDPLHLNNEIDQIRTKGIDITREKLIVSESCFLILPIHKLLDNLREKILLKNKIGTTGRGIGPAYEDKIGRRGLRISDLKHKSFFINKLKNLYDHHNIWISHFKHEEANYKKDLKIIYNSYSKLLPFVDNSWSAIKKLIKEDKKILFEGAQGTFLDLDFGTYPYVTSSNTVSGNASVGSGVGPSYISYTIGIAKAYTTRVGNGPFPTELLCEIGDKIAEKGKEFGTVTGRKRRCGWFDVVLTKQAIFFSGISGLALTKLDVLDDFEKINLCVGYELNGRKVDYYPVSEVDQKNIKPIYKTLPGWKGKTYGITNFHDLPNEAQTFVREIENLVECSIDIISTGPDRENTIILKNIFVK